MTDHELIICIVNAGFSETVMTAAKACGARGGTVINARGTANLDAEAFFRITVQPEKEIVMILVPTDIRDAVLRALYEQAGLNTAGHGISFSMPVTHAVGLASAESAAALAEDAAETKDTATEQPQD